MNDFQNFQLDTWSFNFLSWTENFVRLRYTTAASWTETRAAVERVNDRPFHPIKKTERRWSQTSWRRERYTFEKIITTKRITLQTTRLPPEKWAIMHF